MIPMKPRPWRPRSFLFAGLVAAQVMIPGPAAWSETGLTRSTAATQQTEIKYPKNLARTHLGASLRRMEEIPALADPAEGEEIAGLLSEDATLTCEVSAGRTSFVIVLASIQNVQRFVFINQGSAGLCRAATAGTLWPLDSPGWVRASQSREFSNPGVVSLDLGFRDAKYVRIDFELKTPGHLAGFGLFGNSTTDAYRMRRRNPLPQPGVAPPLPRRSFSRDRNHLDFDLAALYTRTRVAYVSSGADLQDPNRMLDGLADTGYAFDARDSNPTIILDFGEEQNLYRSVLQLDAPKGMLSLYPMDRLPDSEPAPVASLPWGGFLPTVWTQITGPLLLALVPGQTPSPARPDPLPERLTIGNTFLHNTVPAQMIETGQPAPAASANFDLQPARFLMLRWSSSDASSAQPLVIRQMSAFGNEGSDFWEVARMPQAEPLVRQPGPLPAGLGENSQLPQNGGVVADVPASTPVPTPVSP